MSIISNQLEEALVAGQLSEAGKGPPIPGLPSGWSAKGKKEATWSPGDHRYDIQEERGGWCIHHFAPDARTGDRLKVSELPKSVPVTKLAPNARGADSIAYFVHGFDAADAATAYHKATAKTEGLVPNADSLFGALFIEASKPEEDEEEEAEEEDEEDDEDEEEDEEEDDDEEEEEVAEAADGEAAEAKKTLDMLLKNSEVGKTFTLKELRIPKKIAKYLTHFVALGANFGDRVLLRPKDKDGEYVPDAYIIGKVR